MSRPNDHEKNFISFLKTKVLPYSGPRALLKRALRGDPRFVIAAMKFIAPWKPRPGWDEDCFVITAGLFALHPVNWAPTEEKPHTGNLGASMGIFASRSYGAGTDRRFARLIDQSVRASEVALKRHLFSIVMQLRKEKVAVDWAQLLHDLRHWTGSGKWPQRRWARSFYSTLDQRLRA